MPPPSATASSRAIGSPRPVPSASCETNASKIRARCDAGTPGPESTTSTDTTPFADAEPELDPTAVRRPAERVRQEVRDHLEHRSPSDTITGAASAPRDRVVDLPATRLLGERPVRLVEHALEVDLLLAHGEPVSLELREVEHVSDEALEPVGLRRDDLERRPNLVRLPDDAFADGLDVPADRGQRRAELVRHGHEERALELLRLRELVDHPAEALAQERDLVSPSSLRDLDVVTAGGDVLGRAREHADRLGQPA